MKRMILRLDDASEYMDLAKWKKMETILDRNNVKPLFGIIPANKDPELLKFEKIEEFWEIVHSWIDKGWTPALHGFQHVFETDKGGLNPVNNRSEFAGLSYDTQLTKIKEGIKILENHRIQVKVFFAPAHTFDENTIKALKTGSEIRIISDTPAYDTYTRDGITYVPQQTGAVRTLPFRTITFCYHPNKMDDESFVILDHFLRRNMFDEFPLELTQRKESFVDILIKRLYFLRKGIRV